MSIRECEKKAKNGVSIYYYPNPALHGFYISLFVKSGSMYESEAESGITHFLEHALIRNVNCILDSKLYSLLDKEGLEFNASTYSEMVQFYVSGEAGKLALGAEIISKLFEPIALSGGELDAERRRIKSEIRESADRTSLTAFAAKKVFEGTSLAGSIVGTNKAVDRISLRSLENYRKKIFGKNNLFFYVTGAVSEGDLDTVCEIVGRYSLDSVLRNNNVAPVPKKFGKRDAAVFIKRDDYTAARFTFDLDMSRYSMAESDLLYDLLLSGYDSKLFSVLSEERGLVYDISGGSERYTNIGTLSFSYEVKGTSLYECLELTVEILNSLKSEGSFECIRAGYVDNAYMLYDDSRELNFTFAYDNHIMNSGYGSIEERQRCYALPDNARLAELAREIFTSDNLTLAIKTPKRSIDTERIRSILLRLK